MFRAPLVYTAGHMFVDLPEGRWLVDTGSPNTFGALGSITWKEGCRPVPASFGPITIAQIQPHIESPFVGLIGMDLLNAEDSCWDGLAGEFRIGREESPPDAATLRFERVLGVPTLGASIAGQSVQVILDTGARYGYMTDPELVASGQVDGRIDDFNPVIGPIASSAWLVEVDLGGFRFTERAGLLDGLAKMTLDMIGVRGIVGNSWLPGRRVWYQPGEGIIRVSRGPGRRRPLRSREDRLRRLGVVV